MPLGPGRGKGEHEPADPRLFELDTELFGPGSQPVEGKSIPLSSPHLSCMLFGVPFLHTRTLPKLIEFSRGPTQHSGPGAHAWDKRLRRTGLVQPERRKGFGGDLTAAMHFLLDK